MKLNTKNSQYGSYDYNDGYFDSNGKFVKYGDGTADFKNHDYKIDSYDDETVINGKPVTKKNGGIFSGIFIGILFLLWFFGSIGGMLYCSENGLDALIVALFGQYFAVFGLIAFTNGLPKRVKSKKDTYTGGQGKLKFEPIFFIGLGLMVLGFTAVAFGIIFQFGSEEVKEFAMSLVPILLCSIFAIVGAGFIISAIYKRLYANKYMTTVVRATVTKVDSRMSSSSNGHRTRVYAPTYEYDYGGEHIKHKQSFYSNYCKVKQGDVLDVKINPEIPTEMFEGNFNLMFNFIFGGIFLFVGLAGVIAFVMNFGSY